VTYKWRTLTTRQFEVAWGDGLKICVCLCCLFQLGLHASRNHCLNHSKVMIGYKDEMLAFVYAGSHNLVSTKPH
jgi:hypothetical protein